VPVSLFDKAVSLALPAVPKPVVRHFSERYIAGPSVQDAMNAAHALAREGAMSTLDILGEFITRPDEAEVNARAYEDLLRRIAAEALADTNVSVKLSALGLLLDPALCLGLMDRVLTVAREQRNFVRVDMEDARCTDATLDVYRRLRERHPGHVGVVLQSRLRRTVRDVDLLADEAANFRLCKGIYLEPRSIAYTDPELIRKNFVLGLDTMLRRGSYVGVATHDEALVWETLRLVRELGLRRDQYEFQMLLGVDEELRRILLASGHRLRVYVPFGEHWYPYSVRRLRENPQIAGHALRAMFRRA
jgi:proline dehydrogenase